MAKISELTVITEITANDMLMITDAETSASRRIIWSNVESSISNLTLTDNSATALTVKEGSNTYMTFDTTNSSEKIIFDEDVQINDTLSLGGSGSQFFAFNEDTVKVKFANWYSSNTRQYGQGQLWYEQWFGAIDDTAGAANRRIGFYLDTPSHGASDAAGGTGSHPNNARMYIDVNRTYIQDELRLGDDLDFEASADITMVDNTAAALDITEGSNSYIKIDTTNSSELITFGQDVRFDGSITVNQSADIVFEDNAGTFPTNGKGFYWDLNDDEARIYAIQSQSDYIDLVFKVSDNANSQNDRWVFWLDSYQGQSTDAYPLTMSADYTYFFCDPSSTDGKPDTGDWKFRLDSDGAFRNMAPSSVTPTRNGELVVEATSNTTVKIKLKGSDGTVRSVSLTLS